MSGPVDIDDADAAAPAEPREPPAEPVMVAREDGECRLDRWFRRHYPHVRHGELEKWLRTGQVRIDGKRAKASDRLSAGQGVRVPPAAQTPGGGERGAGRRQPTDSEAAELTRRVLFRDQHLIVIDKPAGLAVQGGSKTTHHLDGMLDALRGDGERPRLVHRLDKDTSGVLVLARTAAVATALTRAFAHRDVRKLYWAVVVGTPAQSSGRITQPLAKRGGPGAERTGEDDDGRPAVTDFRIVERAGDRAAWLALEPRTGRTHQLRAHCLLLGTPILGDGKFGGQSAFLAGADLEHRLHLHARAIRLPHPAGSGALEARAPLPEHMRATFRFFGFSERGAGGPAAEWGPDDGDDRPSQERDRRHSRRPKGRP